MTSGGQQYPFAVFCLAANLPGEEEEEVREGNGIQFVRRVFIVNTAK